jgi:hypothetical protein
VLHFAAAWFPPRRYRRVQLDVDRPHPDWVVVDAREEEE